MKLTFEPVTNKIGEDYFIVPKNDEDGVKCVMKCNEVAAFIINLLVENHNRQQMIEKVALQYPNEPIEEVERVVDEVRTALKATITKKPTEEGETKE